MIKSTDFLILYTTKNGRTGKMVDPIMQGLIGGGVTVDSFSVEEIKWDQMLTAKGIIVGTPVRFGNIDWKIKRFFDIRPEVISVSSPLAGKIGGAFTGGDIPGSGAELTLLSMLHILLNHGMIIQGNSESAHYGPISLKDTSDEDMMNICNIWGLHWANLYHNLFSS